MSSRIPEAASGVALRFVMVGMIYLGVADGFPPAVHTSAPYAKAAASFSNQSASGMA